MKSDRLEQTIKHYLINNLPKLEKIKENGKYINPELRLWKNKNLTLSSSAINTLPYSQEEILKQKDALFFIEANQYEKEDENTFVEKDIQIFKIKKSQVGIHKTPLCDIECKLAHFLSHAEGKLSTQLFEKIMNYKFEKLKMQKINFSNQLAFFINKDTQQSNNYYVFCFTDSLSSPKIKTLNPNRELDPTKTSYITNEDFNKYKILCPEITFSDIQEMYQLNKKDQDYFTQEEKAKIKKILSTGKDYFETIFKEEFPFTSTSNKTLCLFPQNKTHKVANGHYRNPTTEKFQGGEIINNYPFISDVYKNYLKNIVMQYTSKNYERLFQEANELTNAEAKKILKQNKELNELFINNSKNKI